MAARCWPQPTSMVSAMAEVLDDAALPSGAGTYYVEVTGDSTNAAQLYQLEMTVSESVQIFDDGFESSNTTKWSGTVP